MGSGYTGNKKSNSVLICKEQAVNQYLHCMQENVSLFGSKRYYHIGE